MKFKIFAKAALVFSLVSFVSLIHANDAKQITAEPWSKNQVIQPEKLAKLLSDSLAVKPFILHVGVHFQFANAHIPGAKHTGMAATQEGIKSLKKEVENLPRNKEIILYCGCCPWNDCPNISPAFKVMQKMGFTNVKVLYISKSFQNDWIDKKLPIER